MFTSQERPIGQPELFEKSRILVAWLGDKIFLLHKSLPPIQQIISASEKCQLQHMKGVYHVYVVDTTSFSLLDK